jgi:hypothetical protein
MRFATSALPRDVRGAYRLESRKVGLIRRLEML